VRSIGSETIRGDRDGSPLKSSAVNAAGEDREMIDERQAPLRDVPDLNVNHV
jgi:hypothetical protein